MKDPARSPTKSRDCRLPGVRATRSLGPAGGPGGARPWRGPSNPRPADPGQGADGAEPGTGRPRGPHRLSPAAPSPLGSEGQKRVTRRDKIAVSPAKRGERAEHHHHPGLVPPCSGPSSSTHSVAGRERGSAPGIYGSAGPALHPPPRAPIGHQREAKAHAHWSLRGRRS